MPNYTITSSTTVENTGDIVSSGTIPTTAVLVITPDTGFVLDASGFSAGTLPATVSSVTFANSTTAFALGNLVNVTVTYVTTLQMASADINIGVNICESGGVMVFINSPTTIKLRFNRLVSNQNGMTHTTTAGGSYATKTSTTLPAVTIPPLSTTITSGFSSNSYANTTVMHEETWTVVGTPGTPITVLTGVINVSAQTSAYLNQFPMSVNDVLDYLYWNHDVYFQYDTLVDQFTSEITAVTATNSGLIDKIEYKIVYDPYSQAQLNAESYNINDPYIYLIEPYWETLYNVVSNYVVNKVYDDFTLGGLPDPNSLPSAGTIRNITFQGDLLSQLSFTVKDASNAHITGSPSGTLTINQQLGTTGVGTVTHQVTFPQSNSTTAYTLVVTAGTSTTLGTLFSTQSPVNTFTYNQIVGTPQINLSNNSTSGYNFSSIPVVQHTNIPPNYVFGENEGVFALNTTITRVNGGNVTVNRSPIWPNDWSNSDPESNNGTEYYITNIATTGSGTASVSLTADVYRIRMGTTDTSMVLALDNWINVTSGTTALTAIVLDTLPVASREFSSGSSITVNSDLTPKNATTTALTWAISGSGATITPSADTQSAVVASSTPATRTVTATGTGGNTNISGTIQVICAANILTAVGETISVYKAKTTTLNILTNDSSQEATIVFDTQPSVGSVSVVEGLVRYVCPNTNINSTSFTYHITQSGFTNSSVVTVNLTLLNQ